MAKKPSARNSGGKKSGRQKHSGSGLKFLEEWSEFIPNVLDTRPFKFDWPTVGKMLVCGSNANEVAASFGRTIDCMRKAFERENQISFSAFYEHCRSTRLNLLRASQTRNALQGDTSMLKFLGKNELGQREKIDVTVSGDPFTNFVKETSNREQQQPESLPDWEDTYLDD